MTGPQVMKLTIEIAPATVVSTEACMTPASKSDYFPHPHQGASESARTTTSRASFQYPSSDSSYPKTTVGQDMAQLFAENIVSKIYRTATILVPQFDRSAEGPSKLTPEGYPEYVPHDGPQAGHYVLREPEFWTCGFFPGTLHSLLERLVRYPQSVSLPPRDGQVDISYLRSNVLRLCSSWSEALHAMADRKDTHDIGFIVMPALQKNWELTGNQKSLESILRAADSLASRFVPSAGSIRSWDKRIQGNLQITCEEENLLLIIDSMCNLDLLYYAASHSSQGRRLYDIATSHASTLMRTHLRPESNSSAPEDAYHGQWYSTYHVVNLDPANGKVKRKFTAQGYSDSSTWARGQAWGILGYAQTYMWTKDKKFLQASCGLAEYFLHRLETSPSCVEAIAGEGLVDDASSKHHRGRYVPLWDFDAPIEDVANPTRDSSAGAIAANGMLVLSQGLAGLGYDGLAVRFRTAAMDIMRDLLNFALAPEMTRFVRGIDDDVHVEDVTPGKTFEGLLKFGTANNNEHAPKRYANHGLVYGDYYLVEFGNRLLRMGFD